MEDAEGAVRSIQWREVFAWTELFRVFRVSIAMPLLGLAFLGAWATSIGWQLAGTVFLSDEAQAIEAETQSGSVIQHWPEHTGDVVMPPDWERPLWATVVQTIEHSPMVVFVQPMVRLFSGSETWQQFFYLAVGNLWNLLVWGVLGGAIARIAAVRLGRDERVGTRDAVKFAATKLASFIGAPLIPLLAVVVLSIPLLLLGLLMRVSFGVVLAGLSWPLISLVGFTMSLFVVGVLFGWPLMWSAISTEGSDAFDAISRSFAYTFQRPLHYLGYVVAAYLLGLLGWLIVSFFSVTIVQLSMAYTQFGMGLRAVTLSDVLNGQSTDSTLLWAGAQLIGFFNRCVLGIPKAFAFSFLWSASACIYLLLRKTADQTELDDVYLPEDDHVTYGLPPLVQDDSGVPAVEE